jgi:Dolichyl-phosphate-mannose-protein mannosyltransferase
MQNIYIGIPVLVVCVAGYIFSYQQERNGYHVRAVSLLMLCGLLLRAYAATDQFLHPWDERYHALVAKHLLTNILRPTLYTHPALPYDPSNWTISSIWLHKQPLTLWLIALSLKIFGTHVWAVRVPSILLSTIGIKLAYDIAAYLYDKRIAWLSALLFSIHGLIIDLAAGRTATDHTDIMFLFFVTMAVWCALKNVQKRSLFFALSAGVAIGCAILCKWLPAMIVIPVWVCLGIKEKIPSRMIVAHLAAMTVAATAVALPWQLYIIHSFPRESAIEYAFNIRHITMPLEGHAGNWFYTFNFLRIGYGELIYIPVIWFIVRMFRQFDLGDLALLIWFLIPYLFFSITATKMPAYTLFAAPAVFMITAKCSYSFVARDGKPILYRSALRIVALGLIILPIRYSIEKLRPFSAIDQHPVWQQNIEQLQHSAWNMPDVVVFNCPHPIETMFACECTCYEATPPPSAIEVIRRSGKKVLILNNDGSLPN